ncbi:unnamed protein product, partial [Durusdinium trenchii]
MDFLKDEAKRAVEKDPEKEKEKENTDHMDAESEEYTPTEPLPPDERPERYRITGKSPAGHLFQPPPANSHHHDSSPPQDEFMEGSSPPWTANAGTHEDEAMDIDADLKQIIQQCLVGCEKSWDGMLDSFYLTDMSQPGVLYSIRYDEIKRESIEVCGTRVWQAVPTLVRDELSSELLDAKLTLAGIRREYGHMSEKQIGTCASGNQAKQLAMEWGIRIIGTRWVIVRKIRKTESGPMEEVRCRCVVQDVRDGTSAVMHGYSSPTSSVETLKILLAVAGWFDYAVLTADVATAYMSSPLPDDVKAIIRLPAGTMYGDGTPVYVILKNAINGLRPASLGSCVAVLTYVDDLLFIAKNLNICRKMLSALREMLEIKETGAIGNKAEKGGELTFIGRRMMRLEGSSKLYVTMEQNFNDALKSAGKGLKPADAMPDLKHYLEADDPASLEPLSPDKQTEFRSALGKVLWMATPQVKHSRALKAMLRFVLGTLDFAQSFPMDTAEEYLAFLERQCIETTLVVYADASYAPMRSLDRRSISGAVIVFLGSMIRAFAKTQHSVTLSSAEAELEALLAAVQEGRGLFKISAFVMGLNEVFHEGHVEFHDEYGSRIKEMIVLTDSSAAKAVLLRQDVQRRLRHSEIKLEFLKSLARRGLIKIQWQPGLENPADALTKVVTRALQLQYRAFLGLVNVQQILASLCAPLICQDLHDSCQEMSSSDSEAESEPQSDVEKGFFNAEGKFQGPTLSLNFSGDSEFVADFLRDVRVFGLQHAEKSEIEDMWNSWRCDYLHRYLMIEFCCAPDSLLADQWMNQGEKYVWFLQLLFVCASVVK